MENFRSWEETWMGWSSLLWALQWKHSIYTRYTRQVLEIEDKSSARFFLSIRVNTLWIPEIKMTAILI